jgi:RimJ/RimL family protein N-acetyltransferase
MLMHPLNTIDFASFAAHSAAGYARDLKRTYGYEDAKAAEYALSVIDEILPQGLDTPGHFIFHLRSDSDQNIGVLWFEVRSEDDAPLTLFIFDLEIFVDFQRQGWAQRALIAVEAWANDRGIRRLELNMFADNEAAQALYRAAAFKPCEITMGKNLG